MRPPATRPQSSLFGEPRPPSLTYLLGIVLVSYLIFVAALSLFGGSYWSLKGGNFGDNGAYIAVASGIRHWQLSGVHVKQFWGVSYAVACLSILTGASEPIALVVVCVGASLVGVALCFWLWDGWIAAFFALLSLDWFQRSLLGGAEPLFIALLLGSFLSLRRDRWVLAAVLASLATVVRPFGVFALVGLGIHLLYRRRFRDCAIATATALTIGALYTWPLKHYLGSPFANVASYHKSDWHGGLPFNFPFVAIIHDTIPTNAPLTNLALTLGWILFVLIAVVVAIRSGEFQHYAAKHTAEAVFALTYCAALYTYDAPGWSRSNFPRFALPLLPWVLVFLRRYIPKNRKVVWVLAVIMPTLAAASALGFRQTWGLLLQRFH
jgi:glycosyl transferase family 87